MAGLLTRLLQHIEVLEGEIVALRAENQALRDENARLKGQKGRPDFKANQPPCAAEDPVQKPKPARPAAPGKKPRAERIEIDRSQTVELDRDALPADYQTRGYREVVVQNIRFERDNVRYRLERGTSASTGQFYEAPLPDAPAGSGYGAELHAFVLLAYFELRIPEEKIMRLLNAQGIVISAGSVATIISQKHLADFAQERAAILDAGLHTTRYQHLDDTGLRVAGVNHHLSVLTNPYFACYFIHRFKNAPTVARLLDLARLDAPEDAPDEASLTFEQRTLRDAIPILVTDGASQFRNQTLYQALCWIHEERHYAKLWLAFPKHRHLLEEQRQAIWTFYERLKTYAGAPTDTEKAGLWQDFDTLFDPTTGSILLDDRLRLTRAKKELLLLVLDFPEVPLENNRAERDLREVVVKRKISIGPRTPDGAQAWEVFFTLLTTCAKQGVNFFAYLLDRISGSYQMPALADLVRAHAPTGS
ncbi:MAG: transposase [Ardenticatenales bacterium]|nr:transposase [Ardenticatenales bacterium]